jgi:hypothetical protein
MDLTTITVDDFKAQFPRDFLYLPVWDVAATYNIGARVYYAVDGLFYDALINGVTVTTPDSGAPDWSTFQDDDINDYVQDSDIERAFLETQLNFNQALFGTDAQITLVYLYVAAHYLVQDLRTALAGVESRGDYLVNSRSVGNVSEGLAVPQRFVDDPILSYFATTGYGRKYLSLLLPRIVGNVVSVEGGTRA